MSERRPIPPHQLAAADADADFAPGGARNEVGELIGAAPAGIFGIVIAQLDFREPPGLHQCLDLGVCFREGFKLSLKEPAVDRSELQLGLKVSKTGSTFGV